MPSTAKGCGQYMNSMLAVQDAKLKGFDEAILLNQEGYISEGSGQIIFYIKDKKNAPVFELIDKNKLIKYTVKDSSYNVLNRVKSLSQILEFTKN